MTISSVRKDPVLRRNMKAVSLILLACLFALFVATPSDVFASGSTATTATCQSVDGGDSNPVNCLPSGRWASAIGSIQTRTEPAGGVFKAFYNIGDKVSKAMRLTMPSMLLMVTQVLWNSALSLSQFAASFDVLDTFGQKLDKSIAGVVSGVMSGGVASVMIVLAVFGVVGAAAFGRGSTGTALKRMFATFLSIAIVSVMGAAAAADGKAGTTTPVAGSPWWVVSTLNKQINNMTVSVDLSSALTGAESNMMSYKHKGRSGHNCQDYVAYMRDEYKATGKSSAVVLTADQLWQETALRSWVTMQWGNPTAGGQSSKGVAANAQQAYCHVLDMQANTPTEVQKNLTNRELGTFIDSTTAKWIFSPDGWIDPWSTVINQKKEEGWDRTDVYPMRAGIFWETCTTDSSYKAKARDGWRVLINNLGDSGSGEIKGNGGSDLRAGIGGDDDDANLEAVVPQSTASKSLMSAGNATTDTSKVCDVVFTNGAFHHSSNKKVDHDTDLGDAAVLGWRFDVPNVSGTWNEANMLIPQSGAQDDVKTTVNYFYGNNEVDTSGAIGTCVGAVVNGSILSLLSLALIVSKIMLLLMLLMLVFAFVIRMFPFGEAANNALKNWFKFTCELCMVGTLYSILGSIATFISSIFLSVTSNMSSTFLYNILAGCSMGIALMVIQLFFSKVLKVRNVFSLGSIMGAVGMGALYNGAAHAIRSTTRGALYRAGGDLLRNRRNKKQEGQHSSQASGPGASSDSAEVLNNNADETSQTQTQTGAGAGQNGTTATTGTGGGETEAAAMPDRKQVETVDDTGEDGSPDDGETPETGTPVDKAVDEEQESAKHPFLEQVKDSAEAGYQRGRNHRFGGGTHLAGWAAGGLAATGTVLGAAWRHRGGAKRVAKLAATAGLAAAALSNPITAPAGLFLAGKALLNRDTRHMMGAAVTLADSAVHQVGRGVGAGANWFRNRVQASTDRANEAMEADRRREEEQFRDTAGVTPDQAAQYALDRQVIRNGGQPVDNPFETSDMDTTHTVTMDAAPSGPDVPTVNMPATAQDTDFAQMGQHFEKVEGDVAHQEQIQRDKEAWQAQQDTRRQVRQFTETMRVEDVHRQAMDAQAPYVQYNDPYKDVPAPTREPSGMGGVQPQPAPQPVRQPAPQPAQQPVPQPASQPVRQAPTQPRMTPQQRVAQPQAPAQQPVRQPVQRPMQQSAPQPAPQPVQQRVSQSQAAPQPQVPRHQMSQPQTATSQTVQQPPAQPIPRRQFTQPTPPAGHQPPVNPGE